jgi:two-component system response regulator (stage 0 sporulation protein A)
LLHYIFYSINIHFIPEGEIKMLIHDVTTILSHMGMKRSIKGFDYIRQAVGWVMEDKAYLDRITGSLYPTVALNNNTTASKVERTIRHAIESNWNKTAMRTLNMYCGSNYQEGSKKPTNSEFIALIADSLKLREVK